MSDERKMAIMVRWFFVLAAIVLFWAIISIKLKVGLFVVCITAIATILDPSPLKSIYRYLTAKDEED